MAIDIVWTSADGNVTATSSYDTAATPANNDSLLLPSTNSQSMTTNMAGLTAIDLDVLFVDKGYGGAVGADGTPFEISSDLAKMFGGQPFHYKDGGGTTDLVIIRCANASTVVTLDGDTLTKVIILRGNVVIKSSTGTIADLEIGWVANRQSDANVTIEAAGTVAITNLRMWGGIVANNAAATTAIINGGILTQDIATITTADVYSGLFNYNFAGTIATLNLRGGTTDFTLNDKTKTVTNTNRFPNSEFKFDDTLTTFTNPVQDMRVTK